MNYIHLLTIAIVTFAGYFDLYAQNFQSTYWEALPIPENASMSVGELARHSSGMLLVGSFADYIFLKIREIPGTHEAWQPGGFLQLL